MNPTQRILDFASANHVLPDAARADSLRLLGDTLAVGAAAVDAPGADQILSAARLMGIGEDVRLLGTDELLPAASAAFVNGYRVHCLEWDAVHEPAVVHALSTVVAALGAAIDRKGGCDPDEALTALAIGVDVASGVGLAADTGLSFFRPATAGLLGAVLAVARIDGAPLDHALGLAYSSAAGTMQAHVEGLATLPFQIANAARAAITASDLAKAGFPGPKDPLQGQFGYFTLFDHGDLTRYTDHIGSVWRISEISTKPYPSGRASHGALGKLEELALDPDDIDSIELACPPLIRRLVERPYKPDMTPAYARLCLQWLSALMITDGRIDPRRFTPEHMRNAKLGRLAQKLTLVADGNDDPNALFPQTLTVTLKDGSRDAHAIAANLGSPDNPLSPAQSDKRMKLARELASPDADPRIFHDPLDYFTRGP